MNGFDGAERHIVGVSAGGKAVTEVQGGELKEVDGQGNLSKDEVCTGPEHDVGKVQKIEQDEMWPNTARSFYPAVVARKQMPYISDLTNKHSNPIDTHKGMINGEWRWVSMALPKRGMPVMVMMMRGCSINGSMVGVVYGRNEGNKPGRDREDAVPENVGPGYLASASKGVIECHFSLFSSGINPIFCFFFSHV